VRLPDGAACAVHPLWSALGEDLADAVEPHGSIHDAEGERRRPGGACSVPKVTVKVRARARARAGARVSPSGIARGGSGAESPFREAVHRSGWTAGPNRPLTAWRAPSGRAVRDRRAAPEVRRSSAEAERNQAERSETRINPRECRPPSWLRGGYSVFSRKKCQASGRSRDLQGR